MRLIVFLAAIAVLFSLSDASAQTLLAASVSAAPLSESQAPSARAAGLRMLSWPGKVVTAPRAKPQAAIPSARRIWNPETAATPTPVLAAPRAPAPILQQATRQTTALPASIYAPPPAASPRAAPAPTVPAPVIQQASAARPGMTQARSSSDGDYQPPHFYSLYREYGQTPDPIPLNPQFFAAATPDLAQPPPPVPHTVTTSSGRVLQAVSPSPDDTPG